MMATRSEHQGRGAGGLLMRWGIDRADAAGVECYSSASEAGRHVYERFGFEEAGRCEFLAGQMTQYFMRRRARGNQAGMYTTPVSGKSQHAVRDLEDIAVEYQEGV